MIIAIDPGPVESAFLLFDGARVQGQIKAPNDEVLAELDATTCSLPRATVAIEMIASYGMPVGAEVFETCVWIGRFMQACRDIDQVVRVKRIEVKSHLCHSGKAKDANVRQALIDRFGGKAVAIGRKAKPGPLYGVSGDCWAALAVAITVADQRALQAAA